MLIDFFLDLSPVTIIDVTMWKTMSEIVAHYRHWRFQQFQLHDKINDFTFLRDQDDSNLDEFIDPYNKQFLSQIYPPCQELIVTKTYTDRSSIGWDRGAPQCALSVRVKVPSIPDIGLHHRSIQT